MTPEEKSCLRANPSAEKGLPMCADTSLRLPPGVAGTIGRSPGWFNRHGIEIDGTDAWIQKRGNRAPGGKDAADERAILNRATYNRLRDMLVGQNRLGGAKKGVKKGIEITEELLEEIDRHGMVQVRGGLDYNRPGSDRKR